MKVRGDARRLIMGINCRFQSQELFLGRRDNIFTSTGIA